MSTAVAILGTNMFEGVLIGLLLAVVKAAWETPHIHIDVVDTSADAVRVRIHGHATFLRLRRILETLELPTDRPVELNLAGVRHLDHPCMSALQHWADQHNARPVQPGGSHLGTGHGSVGRRCGGPTDLR